MPALKTLYTVPLGHLEDEETLSSASSSDHNNGAVHHQAVAGTNNSAESVADRMDVDLDEKSNHVEKCKRVSRIVKLAQCLQLQNRAIHAGKWVKRLNVVLNETDFTDEEVSNDSSLESTSLFPPLFKWLLLSFTNLRHLKIAPGPPTLPAATSSSTPVTPSTFNPFLTDFTLPKLAALLAYCPQLRSLTLGIGFALPTQSPAASALSTTLTGESNTVVACNEGSDIFEGESVMLQKAAQTLRNLTYLFLDLYPPSMPEESLMDAQEDPGLQDPLLNLAAEWVIVNNPTQTIFPSIPAAAQMDAELTPTSLNDSHLLELSLKAPNLRVLDLWGCEGVTHDGLSYILKNCIHLEALDVSHTLTCLPTFCDMMCKQLTSKSTALQELHTLHMSALQRPSQSPHDKTMEKMLTLLKVLGKGLRELNASFTFHNIAELERCMETLSTHCSNLQHLDLRIGSEPLPATTDVANANSTSTGTLPVSVLAKFVQSCKHLQTFVVEKEVWGTVQGTVEWEEVTKAVGRGVEVERLSVGSFWGIVP
ncbi:hypothetical protein HDV05_003232 [Chytridiales sp. JEL 0842]|nr:hypothetical protein HDV05_003232 [Chytridiales sp. JEL 0842]